MDYLIHHMLRRSAARFSGKQAVVHASERLTYAETWQRVLSLASGLRAIGLQRGDRIAVLLGPSIPQVLSIFAASAADAVFVPINHLLFPDQIAHILSDCNVKGLITTSAILERVRGVLHRIPSLAFVVSTASEDMPGEPPVHCFEQLCTVNTSLRKNACIGNDLAAILYTSGSTGSPKGVMLTHAHMIAGTSIVSSYLGITQEDRILVVLPLSFDAGLNQILTAFHNGGTAVLGTFSLAKQIVSTLEKERITGLAGVPTLWNLVAHPSSTLQNARLPALRYITNTGGVLPQSTLGALRKALPSAAVFLMYGFTEAFRSTYLPPEELDRRPTSIGKPIPNTEIWVVNDSGSLCAPGEVGELVHRGPTVGLGYWGQPELTRQIFRPNPYADRELQSDEKVCYSGDLVKMDEEGYLYFVGRRDTMIKSSGYRISPTEVEQILLQTGKIRQAAVIGVPDDMLGQHIKAFVEPESEEASNAESLIRFCAEKLPRYMVPKTIVFVDDLPKTSTGKVDYTSLRKRLDPP
jgi:acyl-CoA ligase (AMP-forming) (exosortase A-associated)